MKKVKVVYNTCFGAFELSREAISLGRKISGNNKWGDEIKRHDPVLVEVVETLQDKADGPNADLSIAEVYEKYRIHKYDGW